MLVNKIVQMIDKSLDIFKHWGCDFSCVKQPCNCDNKDPVSRYVCYSFYE